MSQQITLWVYVTPKLGQGQKEAVMDIEGVLGDLKDYEISVVPVEKRRCHMVGCSNPAEVTLSNKEAPHYWRPGTLICQSCRDSFVAKQKEGK